jgi:tripartite-type tricarboxylate transporter receptor subunit TctC
MKTGKLNMWAKNLGAALAFTAVFGCTAGAQQYPTRAITVIIPFAGGSASDVVSRIMLDKMSKNMGQPIVVENRPGAGGNSGTLRVRAPRPTATP